MTWTVALASSWTLTLSAQQGSGASTDDSSTLSKLRDFAQSHEEPDQGDGYHLTKHWAVAFGDIIPGEGISIGPALSDRFSDGSYGQLKVEYSDRQFALAQARYDSHWWLDHRLAFTTRLRWVDAPSLSFYRIGPRSPLDFGDFTERHTEASLHLLARPVPKLSITLGGGAERYAVGGGTLRANEDESLLSIPPLPGLSSRDWFTHLSAGATLDSRKPTSEYSRTGGVISVQADKYRAWHGPYSFHQVQGTAERLASTFDGRGIVDALATVWISTPSSGGQVPFFLMPTLGGGDYLEGYRLYRFRDRDAALVRGEYRWAVHSYIDLAAAYELGQVAPRAGAFAIDSIRRSVAAGVRVHSATATLFTFDLAHSREGFEVAVNVGLSPGR
ncbi:MAG: hypothetical protein ACRD1V_11195 [Vicinamibacterales bacterium]